MAEVKTRGCDIPDCTTYGPDVLTLHVRAGRVKSAMDLCRAHRRPVVEMVELTAGWSGRTAPDQMALAAGTLIVDL